METEDGGPAVERSRRIHDSFVSIAGRRGVVAFPHDPVIVAIGAATAIGA